MPTAVAGKCCSFVALGSQIRAGLPFHSCSLPAFEIIQIIKQESVEDNVKL